MHHPNQNSLQSEFEFVLRTPKFQNTNHAQAVIATERPWNRNKSVWPTLWVPLKGYLFFKICNFALNCQWIMACWNIHAYVGVPICERHDSLYDCMDPLYFQWRLPECCEKKNYNNKIEFRNYVSLRVMTHHSVWPLRRSALCCLWTQKATLNVARLTFTNCSPNVYSRKHRFRLPGFFQS